MLSGLELGDEGGVPMSLRLQIEVETSTCFEIVELGFEAGLVDRPQGEALKAAVRETSALSRQWIEDAPDYLAEVSGESVYHDVARALGVRATAAHESLSRTAPGTPGFELIEELIWASGRNLDRLRGRTLAQKIEAASG